MNLRHPRRKSLLRLLTTLLAVHALLLGAGWLVASPASAAGVGVLDLQLSPVNLATASPITEASNGTNDNRVSYRVQYSCTTAACDDTQVALSPPPADPHGLLPAGEWILKYEGWAAPSAGGTITGDDVIGRTVDLGDLAAGSSGSFSVTYAHQATRNREVPNGSFYPDGFQIEMSGEISSPTAVGPVSRDAAPVTWHIGTPTAVTGTLGPTNATFDTDVPVSYRLAFNPGNMTFNPGTNNAGSADLVATGNYQVVHTLPAQAEIVSATHGGVIDHATNTVTWTKGSLAAPSYGARGGWGPTALSGYNSSGAGLNNTLVSADDDAFWQPRDVVVRFPGGNFPEAINGCNFTKQVTSTVDVTVNYLDTARTLGTMSRALQSRVACTIPFGGLGVEKSIANGAVNQGSNGDGNLGGSPAVLALNVPAPGETDTGIREWRVRIANQGNVAATAVIDEPALAHDHIKVHQIRAYAYTGAPPGWQASVEWVDNTGATGTAALGNDGYVDALPGRWFVSARTTAPLAAGRILPGDATSTQMHMGYRFRVDDGAVAKLGEERTNTAHITLQYPADADGDGGDDDYTTLQGQPLPSRAVSSDAVRVARYTQPSPLLAAGFTAAPVVTGGGNPTPGTEVAYQFRGRTSDVWPGTSLRPQLVFVAPAGWDVVAGSAQFVAAGTGNTLNAPAGVAFEYETRTVNGEPREVVVVTWPNPIAISSTSDDHWPTLEVRATPTAAAVPGTPVTATALAGDASGAWHDATSAAYLSAPSQFRTSTSSYLDGGDVDADADSSEAFAQAASTSVVVAATDGVVVVKELCIPDSSAADGCVWAADPSQVHSVPVAATGVKYRLRVTNAGNTNLSDVVAYDVLPYVGDTGLLANPPARGSEFAMTIESVESISAGVGVAFSSSTNPSRPEVNPGAVGTVDDWGPGAAGKQAIRIAVASLPGGESREVVFLAAVADGAEAEQKACNTVAVDSSQTLPVEPLAVCVQLADADLSIELAEVGPLVPGQSGILSYDVVNHGGNTNAPGTVEVALPAQVTLTALTIDGWECVAPSAAPVSGPATLTCAPVTPTGDPRALVEGVVDVLALPITVAAELGGTTVCFPASVQGPLHDPVPGNNDTDGCRSLGEPRLSLAKVADLTTDGGAAGVADEGDVITYTFTVVNEGPVALEDVVVTDPMPGLSAIAPATVDTLAPSDDAAFTATYEVSQADIDAGVAIINTAAASASGPNGSVDADPASATVPVASAAPGLLTDKEATLVNDNGNEVADLGEKIAYTFTVRNTGNVTVQDVAVTDPMVSGITPASATIAPGGMQVFTADDYTVTQVDIDNGLPIVNRASAAGLAPDGVDVSSPDDTTSTDIVGTDARLTLVKEAELTTDEGAAAVADRGDVITYTFSVHNAGNVTMTNVAIDDDLPGLSPTVPLTHASLAPDEDVEFTATYTVTQADVDAGGMVQNSATAVGRTPHGASSVSTPSTTDTPVVTAAPALAVDKIADLDDVDDNGTADPGERVAYTFVVTNTGNVTISGVAIDEALDGVSVTSPALVASLAPGADAVFTASYEVSQDDIDSGGNGADGFVHNSARAIGQDPAGDDVASTPDTTDTAVVAGLPGIVVDKVSDLVDANGNGLADVDEEVSYTFEVTNTGNVTLSNVTVTDPEVSGISPASTSIAPGATVTFTADDYVVTQQDIDDGVVRNVATVGGETPGGDPVEDQDIDLLDTVEAHPDVRLVKSSELTYDQHNAGKADVDDVITYTFTVTNHGAATAFDVAVDDPMPGLSALSPASVPSLTPGASETFTATYTVTRKDVESDRIENVASVSWVGPTRGGVVPAPVSALGNVVSNATGGLGAPKITTKASSKKAAVKTDTDGTPRTVRLHDTVTVAGLVPGGKAEGLATLYGPADQRSQQMCTPADAVATVAFTPRNGTFRTPSVVVSRPGHYTWVVRTTADKRNAAATHKCGLATESTLVHRVKVDQVTIDTGHAGTMPDVQGRPTARKVAPGRVSVPAIGMDAPIDTVGMRAGSMIIPTNVRRGGWLSRSAAPGEEIGATVIAGHVSDRSDRPGAFGKLRKARKGQVIVVTDGSGKTHRYRITRIHVQKRTAGLSGKSISSTGKHRLTLVTCTGKVTHANGRFHYTKNLVVSAKKIG